MVSRLEIQEIPASCKTIKLIDTSNYNPQILVSNGVLEVTPPGFSCPVDFSVTKDFSITLNSSTLLIAPAITQADLIDLPDGVYYYKYSIQPNDQLFVEYSSLRNCQLLKKYNYEVCELFSQREKITRKEFEYRRRKLVWIKELIDASKMKVDDFGEQQAGIEMYNEAERQLDKRWC